jgi:morphogenetic protein associated with SpoVID
MFMKIHIVKKGDTLYGLAQKYHVDLQKLIEMNPIIADPDDLVIGLKVKIPSSPQPALPPTDYAYKHVVVQGDTLWKLSQAAGVPLDAVIKANPQLKNPNVLLTGEIVYIPKAGTSMPHEGAIGHENHQQNIHPGKISTAPIQPIMPEQPFIPPVPEQPIEAVEPQPEQPEVVVIEQPEQPAAPVTPAPPAAMVTPVQPTQPFVPFSAPAPITEETNVNVINVEKNLTINEFPDSFPMGMPLLTDEAQQMALYQSPHMQTNEPAEDLFAQFHIPAVKAGDCGCGSNELNWAQPYPSIGAPAAWGIDPAAMQAMTDSSMPWSTESIPMGMPMGSPMGMPMGLPMGMQTGLPMGMPMGSPIGSPMGMQTGLLMGMPTGLPMGMPTGLPMGMPMGSPMGMGQPQPLDLSQAYIQSAGPGMPMHSGAVLPAYGYPCPPYMMQPAYAPMMYGMPSPNFGDCGCGGGQAVLNESFTMKDEKIDIRKEDNDGEASAKVSEAKPKKSKSAKTVVRAFVSSKKSTPKQKRRTKQIPWINI